MKRAFFIFSFLLCATALTAQRGDRPDDNVIVADTLRADTASTSGNNGFLSLFRGKPGKAALYSLIIPGGGQIYNRKWWKVPLAWGLDGTTLFLIFYHTNNYNDWQEIYLALLNGEISNYQGLNATQVKPYRDNARKNREYAYIYFAVGHLITVIDAFVDRHLIDFDISDDLSMKIGPPIIPGTSPTIGLFYNFGNKKPNKALTIP